MKYETLTENCNAFLDEIMNLNDLPGLAIGVSIGGTGLPDPAKTADPTDSDGHAHHMNPGGPSAHAAPAEFIGVRGYRDYAARTPLSEDDIFHCASVSKLFTSSAIMKLVEAGVLDLNARLCDLLPDLHIADRRCEEIRLWNMLTHTSGLGDVVDYHWYDFETDEDSLRRYVYENEEVLTQPMLWDPQECCFRYSNIAYEILGQIVSEYSIHMPSAEPRLPGRDTNRMPSAEPRLPGHDTNHMPSAEPRLPGRDTNRLPSAEPRMPEAADPNPDAGGRLSYEDFVTHYLLKPIGMAASTMKTFERPGAPDFASNEHMAQPHEKKPDRSIGPVQYYPYTRQHAPSSTLTSNVRDLLRWGCAHLASARGCSCGGAVSGRTSNISPASEVGAAGTPTDSSCHVSAGIRTPLLCPETYRKIWHPYATVPNNGEQMGLGWFMREQTVTADDGTSRTYRLCGHEGTDDGFRASFWICPELDMVTVVLSNLSGAPVKRINKKLFERITR